MKKHGLNDLQLLGIRLHNFYQPNHRDPIWVVGSAFFSGRRAPLHEEAALKRLEPLVHNSNFNRRDVLAAINDLRRVMRQSIKEEEDGTCQTTE